MTTLADLMRLRDAVTIASHYADMTGDERPFEIASDAKLDAMDDLMANGSEADRLMTKVLRVIDYGDDI
jgi:hypothetical protein